MKTNTKTKKVSATKSKVPAKTTVKSTLKAKTPVKAVKAPVKAAAKTPAKAVKKVSTPVKTAKAPAKKAVAAKAAPKSVAKAVKTPVKAVKQVKTAVKAAPKAAKPVVEIKKTAIKAVSAPVKAPTKAATVATSKPIIVKMPENQNVPARTNMIASVRPAPTMNKMTDSASAMARPVYRPIQVINKPLTPLQPVRQMAPVAKSDEKVEFKKGDYVVYPAHGVGEIEAVETQIIGGVEIKLYAIAFEKDRMRLKVPVFKAHASGLRRLSTTNRMQDALKTLQGRAQIRRAMWSRRAQEYETKINSGDPVSIAEVLRDLKRSNDESEQSYSERQIYQSALERLAREVAAVEKITEIEAAERLENMIRGKRARAATTEEPAKEVANG